MEKVIRFNTPTGQHEIPLLKIAENRAQYYADQENFNSDSQEWDEEISLVMEDDFEGIDWLINNTNFEDWEGTAVKINSDERIDEEDFWTSSDDFEIVVKLTDK